jgi:hypothetical protein
MYTADVDQAEVAVYLQNLLGFIPCCDLHSTRFEIPHLFNFSPQLSSRMCNGKQNRFSLRSLEYAS